MAELIKLSFRREWLESTWNLLWRWQPEFPIDVGDDQYGEEVLKEARAAVEKCGAKLCLRPDLPDKRGPNSLLWSEAAVAVPDEQRETILAALQQEMEQAGKASPLAQLFTVQSLGRIGGEKSVHKGRGGHTARTLTRAKLSGDVGPSLDNITPLRAFFAGLNLG